MDVNLRSSFLSNQSNSISSCLLKDGSYPGTGKVDKEGHGDGDGTEIKFAYTWRVR